MHERQLGDRLSDDGKQGARPLELLSDRVRARTRPQRVCGSHAEGRETAEQLLVGRVTRLEHELQDSDRRLAERQRRDRRRRGHRHDDGPSLAARLLCCGAELLGRRDAEFADELGRFALVGPPERAAAGACRLDSEARDLVGGAAHVRSRGERVARKGQGVVRDRPRRHPVEAERPKRERELRGRKPGESALAGRERTASAHQLDRTESSGGHEQDVLGVGSQRRPPHRLGQRPRAPRSP